LKCFSLISFNDKLLIPLLRRLKNLEELILYLPVTRYDTTYTDGIQSYDQILFYMPRLNRLIFCINTTVLDNNIRVDLLSDEDIQRSFTGRGNGKLVHMSIPEPWKLKGRCYIYSLPFQLEYFLYLGNTFQGGMFDKVRYLKMIDTRSSEHKLSSNSSVKIFLFSNCYIYVIIKHKKTRNIFLHRLHFLILRFSIYRWDIVDYAEQFLFTKNTHLSRSKTFFRWWHTFLCYITASHWFSWLYNHHWIDKSSEQLQGKTTLSYIYFWITLCSNAEKTYMKFRIARYLFFCHSIKHVREVIYRSNDCFFSFVNQKWQII
jgi:hypothetical protein